MATRILSTPTTVSVVGPLGPGNWGTGSDAGTYANNLWTPGRDATGVVNLVSWNLVPLNRWVEVANTKIDSLDARVKAAVPGWRDYGNEGWSGVVNDWNGMAWDVRAGYERGWLAVAGGHAGSSNDGIYRFDLRKMAWAVQRMPMNPSNWAASYVAAVPGGSATMYIPAANYYTGRPNNAEGVWWDEFYDPGNPDAAHSPRTPTARHTYQSCVYVPSLGTQGKILMACRRYWEYDIAANTWAQPKFPLVAGKGETQATFAQIPGTGYTGENMVAWYNRFTNKYYVASTQEYAGDRARDYNWCVTPGGSDFTEVSIGSAADQFPAGGYYSIPTAGDVIDDVLWYIVYQVSPAIAGKPWLMLKHDLQTRTTTQWAIIIGASFDGATFSTAWDGQGVTYVKERNKFLVPVLLAGGVLVWAWLDNTTHILERATDIGGLGVTNVDTKLENKFKYLPEMHAVVWICGGIGVTNNARLLRVA